MRRSANIFRQFGKCLIWLLFAWSCIIIYVLCKSTCCKWCRCFGIAPLLKITKGTTVYALNWTREKTSLRWNLFKGFIPLCFIYLNWRHFKHFAQYMVMRQKRKYKKSLYQDFDRFYAMIVIFFYYNL